MEKDWAQLDKTYKHNYYEDRLKIANDLGYDYISEAVIKSYRKNQSCKKTGELFEMSAPGISSMLKIFKEPLRGPGGANRGFSILQIFKQDHYDHDKYFLGPLCINNHNWNNTGKSLKHSYGYCIMCQYIKNQERYYKKSGAEGVK